MKHATKIIAALLVTLVVFGFSYSMYTSRWSTELQPELCTISYNAALQASQSWNSYFASN